MKVEKWQHYGEGTGGCGFPLVPWQMACRLPMPVSVIRLGSCSVDAGKGGAQHRDAEGGVHCQDLALGTAGAGTPSEAPWSMEEERVFYKMGFFREFCVMATVGVSCMLFVYSFCGFDVCSVAFYSLNFFVESHLKQEGIVRRLIKHVFWMSRKRPLELNQDKLRVIRALLSYGTLPQEGSK